MHTLGAGTVSHQAMEVLHDGRITRSSDVYSFAMIMLEMITGVPVYEGFSASQVRNCPPLFSTHRHTLESSMFCCHSDPPLDI